MGLAWFTPVALGVQGFHELVAAPEFPIKLSHNP